MKNSTNTLFKVIAYFVIYIIWGSNFISIYYAIKSIPPFIMVGSRFFIAGVLILGIAIIRGEKIPALNKCIFPIKQGLWLNVGGTGALVWSEQYVPSGLASFVVACVPLWMVVMDIKNWKIYYSNFWMLTGLFSGLSGVILLSIVGNANQLVDHGNNFYFGLTVLFIGTFCWSYGSLNSKHQKSNISLLMNLAIQMVSAGLILFIIGIFFGELLDFSFQNISINSIIALSFLILFGSIIGYTCYIWLLKIRPAAEVGTYTFVNPVVAVILGVWMANENISGRIILGMILILIAVILMKYYNKIKISTNILNSFKKK